jgi:hypothetical protein
VSRSACSGALYLFTGYYLVNYVYRAMQVTRVVATAAAADATTTTDAFSYAGTVHHCFIIIYVYPDLLDFHVLFFCPNILLLGLLYL